MPESSIHSRVLVAALAAVLALLALAAPASAGERPPGVGLLFDSIPELDDPAGRQARTTYVGVVAGSNAYVAVVVGRRDVVVYVCDGRKLAAWFGGARRGARLTGAGRGGLRLVATRAGRTLTGSVTIAGRAHRFSARQAVEGRSGLFRASELIPGHRRSIGWIIDVRKGVRGAVKSGTEIETGLSADADASGDDLSALPHPDDATPNGTAPAGLTAQDCFNWRDSLIKQRSTLLDAGIRSGPLVFGYRVQAELYKASCNGPDKAHAPKNP